MDGLVGGIVLLAAVLIGAIVLTLLYFLSGASTQPLAQHYATTGSFEETGGSLSYLRIGFMTYNHLGRVGGDARGLYLSLPGQPALFIPWDHLTVSEAPGFAQFSFDTMVTFRARRAPGTPIVIRGKIARELQQRAGAAWPRSPVAGKVADTPPAPTADFDASAARELKKLGSPWDDDGEGR